MNQGTFLVTCPGPETGTLMYSIDVEYISLLRCTPDYLQHLSCLCIFYLVVHYGIIGGTERRQKCLSAALPSLTIFKKIHQPSIARAKVFRVLRNQQLCYQRIQTFTASFHITTANEPSFCRGSQVDHLEPLNWCLSAVQASNT